MTVHFVHLLDALRRRSIRMASTVEDIVQEACEATHEPDEALAKRVMARDREVDQEEIEIEAEIVRLMALYQPVGIDLRLLCAVLKVNGDLERIADCAVNIAERSRHLELQQLTEERAALNDLCAGARRILRDAIETYRTQNADAARRVLTADEEVDALYGQMVRHVVSAAPKAADHIAAYLDLLSVAKNLERIADHATNIAEDVVFLETGQIVRHQGA
jgi:phosphate transport system protein